MKEHKFKDGTLVRCVATKEQLDEWCIDYSVLKTNSSIDYILEESGGHVYSGWGGYHIPESFLEEVETIKS